MTRLQVIYALADKETRARIDAMTLDQRAHLVAICERDGMFSPTPALVAVREVREVHTA